jgi:hypothetical protein
MRRALCILFIVSGGCGDDGSMLMPDGNGSGSADGPEQQCLAQGAVGTFYRRTPNPRLTAGGHTFSGATVDTELTDPDLVWDEAGQLWHLYYYSPHGASFSASGPGVIRHATSANFSAWTFDDAPSLSGASGQWDAYVASPSVVIDPAASAGHRYMMMYSGASTLSPADWGIGVAYSADGHVFTRASQVLDGAQILSASQRATVSDPDVVLANGTYHVWFSTFGCSGTSCATTDVRGIGHATSPDGTTWTLDTAATPSLSRTAADKASGGERPTVIYDAPHCAWELWLTNEASATENDNQTVDSSSSSGLWRATSTNGTSWTINYAFARDFVWDGTADGEGLGMRAGADIAIKSTGRYMLYTGFDDQGVPSGSTLPTRTGSTSGVMTLNLATRDAPPL